VVVVVVEDIDVVATVVVVVSKLLVIEVLAEEEAAFVVFGVPAGVINVILVTAAVLFASIFVVLADVLDRSVGEFALSVSEFESADGVEELNPVDEKEVKSSSAGVNLLVAESIETVIFAFEKYIVSKGVFTGAFVRTGTRNRN
jgi:hypothetical protein